MTFISEMRRLALNQHEVVPNTYQLTIGGVNVVLIAEEELTLIDSGLYGSTPQVLEFIRKLGRSPEELTLIILTHRHIDHIGGLSSLRKATPAKVAIHQADITDGKPPPPRTGVKHRLLQLPGSSTIRKVLAVTKDDVDIRLQGGEVLDILGGLKVVHTPGHTPGGICLFAPKHKLLVTGDVLRKRRKSFLLPPKSIAGFDREKAFESVKKIYELDFDKICTGHGLPVSGDARAMVEELIEKSEN